MNMLQGQSDFQVSPQYRDTILDFVRQNSQSGFQFCCLNSEKDQQKQHQQHLEHQQETNYQKKKENQYQQTASEVKTTTCKAQKFLNTNILLKFIIQQVFMKYLQEFQGVYKQENAQLEYTRLKKIKSKLKKKRISQQSITKKDFKLVFEKQEKTVLNKKVLKEIIYKYENIILKSRKMTPENKPGYIQALNYYKKYY